MKSTITNCLYMYKKIWKFSKKRIILLFILALRGQIISSTYKKIKSGIISDIENIKFLELRKYMYEAFRAPAKNLIEAFRKEYLNVIKYNYAIYCKACGK